VYTLPKPIAKKMIQWFEGIGLSDTPVTENYLCYHFRDLFIYDSNNPFFLLYTRNDKMRLIIAIELLDVNKTPRGLKHVSALINSASAHERAHYVGQGLLDAFQLFERGEMISKIIKKGKSVGYCFLHQD